MQFRYQRCEWTTGSASGGQGGFGGHAGAGRLRRGQRADLRDPARLRHARGAPALPHLERRGARHLGVRHLPGHAADVAADRGRSGDAGLLPPAPPASSPPPSLSRALTPRSGCTLPTHGTGLSPRGRHAPRTTARRSARSAEVAGRGARLRPLGDAPRLGARVRRQRALPLRALLPGDEPRDRERAALGPDAAGRQPQRDAPHRRGDALSGFGARPRIRRGSRGWWRISSCRGCLSSSSSSTGPARSPATG